MSFIGNRVQNNVKLTGDPRLYKNYTEICISDNGISEKTFSLIFYTFIITRFLVAMMLIRKLLKQSKYRLQKPQFSLKRTS